MDHHATWPPPRTLRSSSSQSLSTQTHSLEETTFSSSPRPSCGRTTPTRSSSQPTPTSELSLLQFSMHSRMRSHGSESNKNIPSWPRTVDSPLDHSDGQQMDTQDLKDHTTAQLVETLPLVEPSTMPITSAAFMLDSTFLELMLKSCQDNGNSRSVHAQVLSKETI